MRGEFIDWIDRFGRNFELFNRIRECFNSRDRRKNIDCRDGLCRTAAPEGEIMTTRTVQHVVQSVPTSDGAGVKLRRSLGVQGLRLDPFLMLDEFSSDNPNDYIAGFP